MLAVAVSNQADAATDDGKAETHVYVPLRDWAASRSRFALELEFLHVTDLEVRSDAGFSANPDLEYLTGGFGGSYAYKIHPNAALLLKTSAFALQRKTPKWKEDEPLSSIFRQTFGAEASWQRPRTGEIGVEWGIGAAVGPNVHVFDDLRAIGVSVEVRTSLMLWIKWSGIGFGGVFHYDHAKAYETSGWNKDALKGSRLDLISGNALVLFAYRF